MPSLRIALDVEPREFELDYSGGTISLSTPDGSPVHPGIRHIANFWMKMLSLPASPASIQRLHARLVPGGTPPLAMSPIYLLMTIKSLVRRPLHFDWPEDQRTIAWLRVSFEETDGEGTGCTEVVLEIGRASWRERVCQYV